MRLVIAFLILFMISLPSGAKCSCGGGASAGFNFLGDSSFNVDMTSFDEFSRGSYLANNAEESVSSDIDRAKKADADTREGTNDISLDLDDGSHVDLILFPGGNDLFGRGNMSSPAGASEALGAVGIREEYRLILELVSLKEEPCMYRFDLLEDDSAFLGDYVKITPEGRTMRGTARGVWDNKVMIIIGKGTRPL